MKPHMFVRHKTVINFRTNDIWTQFWNRKYILSSKAANVTTSFVSKQKQRESEGKFKFDYYLLTNQLFLSIYVSYYIGMSICDDVSLYQIFKYL